MRGICSLGTQLPPNVRRYKDLVHSIDIIKSDFDVPKANKAKIFESAREKIPKVYEMNVCI